jgi:hypothetical protein
MSSVLDSAMKDQRSLSEVGLTPEFSSTNRVITSTTSDGLPVEAFVKFAEEPTRLLCLLPSAQPRSKAPQIPFFPRWSWASGFDGWDVVSLSDPMLHAAPALHASWFVNSSADVTKELAGFLGEFCRLRQIPLSGVTLYGSSMGGFGALMIASSLPGARAVAEVPQLNLLKYPDPQALADVELLALGGTRLEEVEQLSPEKVNVAARFQHSDYIPPLCVLTNRADGAHTEALEFLAAVNAIAPTVARVGPTSVVQLPSPEGHAVQPTPFMIETLKALAEMPIELADGRPKRIEEAKTVPMPRWDVSSPIEWENLPLAEAVTWVESKGNGEAHLELEVFNSGTESQKGIVLCVAAASPDEAVMNRAGFRFSAYRGIGYFKYLRVPSGTSRIRESVKLDDQSEILGFGLAAWDLEAPRVTNLHITYRDSLPVT